MERITGLKTNLDDVVAQLLNVGFINSADTWADGVVYKLSINEVEHLEKVSGELYQNCLDFLSLEIKKGDYQGYQLTESEKEQIETSWKLNSPDLLGKFSFDFDGKNFRLLKYNSLEFNGLLHASITQARWLEQVNLSNSKDQFNWIHQALLNRLAYLRETLNDDSLYIDNINNDENLIYLKDVFTLADWKIAADSLTSAPLSQNIEPAWKLLLNKTEFLNKLSQSQKDNPVFSLFTDNTYSHTNTYQTILNTWIVGESVCGIGIEEISNIGSGEFKFVPHFFMNE